MADNEEAFGDNMVEAFRAYKESGGGANTSEDIGSLNLPKYDLGGSLSESIDTIGASGPTGNPALDAATAAAQSESGPYDLGGGLSEQIDTIGASGVFGDPKLDDLAAAAGLDVGDYDLGGGLSESIDTIGASGPLGNPKLDELAADAGVDLSLLYNEQRGAVDDEYTLPKRSGEVAPPDSGWAKSLQEAVKAAPGIAKGIVDAVKDNNTTQQRVPVPVPPPAPAKEPPITGVSTNMPRPPQTGPSPQVPAQGAPAAPPRTSAQMPAPASSGAGVFVAVGAGIVCVGLLTGLGIALSKRRKNRRVE